MTLTSAEMKTIDNLAESLFTVALRNARRRAIHWPPASYSLDSKHLASILKILCINNANVLCNTEPDDLSILDLTEFSQTLPPVRRKKRLFTRELQGKVSTKLGAFASR